MNVTGTRISIITSPSGVNHAARRRDGRFMRRLDWRLTECGQMAEHGWSQHARYGYPDCKSCIRLLEERVQIGR